MPDGTRITRTCRPFSNGTSCTRTPIKRGAMPSLRRFSSASLMASVLSSWRPGRPLAIPFSSSIPNKMSPPCAFANELTSARNSLTASAPPSGKSRLNSSDLLSPTWFSIRRARSAPVKSPIGFSSMLFAQLTRADLTHVPNLFHHSIDGEGWAQFYNQLRAIRLQRSN